MLEDPLVKYKKVRNLVRLIFAIVYTDIPLVAFIGLIPKLDSHQTLAFLTRSTVSDIW